MVVKEIIEKMLIRLDKVADYDLNEVALDSEVVTMIKCINMVIAEIASDYLPARSIERVNVVDGKVLLTNLSKRLIKIISVKRNGSNVKWRLFPEFVTIEDSDCGDIDYCYLPDESGLEDNIAMPPQITCELLCYGALSEYCLIKGRYEDSMIYDRRYKDSLVEACRTRKEVRIKARAW